MPHEASSVFDIFKIGIGPSSSHTLGPWKAAIAFLHKLMEQEKLYSIRNVQILLYGSLAKTGKGHGTDLAIKMGLMGENPETTPVEEIEKKIEKISFNKEIKLNNEHTIHFDPQKDIIFLFDEILPFHPNGMSFLVTLNNSEQFSDTYYSIGGGFVVQEGEKNDQLQQNDLPIPIDTACDLHFW